MPENIIVGPINKGLRNDRTAFVIDNDSFPTLINAYQWRGRVKRKRGTSFLTRLTIAFLTNSIGMTGASPWTFNLFSLAGINKTVEANPGFVPNAEIQCGSVIITIQAGPNIVFTDQGDGTLTSPTPGNSGIINYVTGVITLIHTAGPGIAVIASFRYYPNLPVMGLEELNLTATQFPGTLAFDTKYAYNILTAEPYLSYNVNFYKNPPAVPPYDYLGYIPKTVWTSFVWNGQDYQQFWTINYQGALWATNGINIPFTGANIGMQFKAITGMVITLATAPNGPSIVTLTIPGNGLVVGDFLFINEVIYTAPNLTNSINFQTGYVIATSGGGLGADQISVEFPNAYLTGTYSSGGIAQYLTNNADPTLDGIRWYDGDPTSGNPLNPIPSSSKGWVNFAPPLSREAFGIQDAPAAQYYLAGARMIAAFKDRLLFLGPVIQTSAPGSQIYLQDTIVYSQNGTPYYTASFTGDPSLPTTVFTAILTPVNQTATVNAYWEDQTGFGGFVSAATEQPLISSNPNEDVLICGFENQQTRLLYTGNDIIPFTFYLINSELGTSSTFSAINTDTGVISRGSRGYVITGQTQTQRIDLPIPDEVFEIRLTGNGTERICSQRDYINEWIYFTYPANTEAQSEYKFPTQTLQYNYRDDSWAIFRESYTTYGLFKRRTGFIWSTVGTIYPNWSSWNDPWNSGTSTLLQPEVIAGNQQGFVLARDNGTNEGNSLYIKDITGSIVTSPDHSLIDGDYIIISDAHGTVSQYVNGKIFSVSAIDEDTFALNPNIVGETYIGCGVIKRMYVPFIQTRQFPAAWDIARKTRLGPQQYLFTTTENGQIQLLIFLSQNADSPYNDGSIVPNNSNLLNSALVYSTLLYTCPESTNLGLTPANVNLNSITGIQQQQIWHRMNTSLLGDTIQVGFTMSDEQMRSLDQSSTSFSITGASQTYPLVLTTNAGYSADQLILIKNVMGMTQLNGNYYNVISSTATTVTIDVDATGFSLYTSGGTVTGVSPVKQFSEIELHSFILQISPSQVLA